MEVIPIFKTESKHDVVVAGETLKLRLVSCCRGGIVIQYTKEQSVLAPELAKVFGLKAPTQVVPVVELAVHLNWLERLLRLSIEKKVQRRLKTMKQYLTDRQKEHQRALDLEHQLNS